MKTICFANVKGGVGKSSLTIVAANVLADFGFSVTIVDCDIAQKTCYSAWQMSDNPSYDVIQFDPAVDEKGWETLIKDIEGYDYVFFDIPGSVFQSGVITLLKMMDKLIIVTRWSPKDLSSTEKFITQVLRENDISEFRVLLNMLRPYRDSDHKDALAAIESGEPGPVSDSLGIAPNVFFKNNIMDEQAAIEKNMEIGEIHNKIRKKYEPFFEEFVAYVEQE